MIDDTANKGYATLLGSGVIAQIYEFFSMGGFEYSHYGGGADTSSKWIDSGNLFGYQQISLLSSIAIETNNYCRSDP